MDHVYSTTTKHEKRKHLFYDEQVLIQIRLKGEWSDNKISKEIICPPNTVRNDICRGTISLYRGNVKRYKTEVVPAESSCKLCDLQKIYGDLFSQVFKTIRQTAS